jgi:DNA-binding response OmpR family regulator
MKEIEMPLMEAVLERTANDLEANQLRKAPVGPRARILSVSAAPQDHSDLRRIVTHPLWRITAANSFEDAIPYLSRSDTFVIFCEHALPDGSWKQMLDRATSLPAPPPVIVTSRLADDYLWAEVLNLGGFDVLAKPYNEKEVRHVLDSAWVHRLKPVNSVRAAVGAA